MKSGTTDIADILVPAEDGAVARALEELEAKLSAFTSAVKATQSSLTARATEFERLEAAESAGGQRGAAPDAITPESRDVSDVGVEASEDMVDAPMPVAVEEPPATHDADPDVTRENVADAPMPAAVEEPPATSEADSHRTRAAGPLISDAQSLAAAVAARTVPEQDSDVESLLASIDPKLAASVRERIAASGGAKSVRELVDDLLVEEEDNEQLLNSLNPEMAEAIRIQHRLFNGRKSIQELIEKYESKPAEQPKSLWKRIRG